MALLTEPLQSMALLTGENKNLQSNRDSVAPENLGVWVTPAKPNVLFNGLPLFPHELWTKKSLMLELDKLEGMEVTEGTVVISKREVIHNFVENGKSSYGDVSSI